MRRPVFALALLAVLLVPAAVTPRSVAACTLDPAFDPLEEMDTVIAGRAIDLRVAETWDGVNAFVPVWVDFRVETYLRGAGPDLFSALDPVSVIFEDLDAAQASDFSAAQFAGGGGACGALWNDPRGEYWVTAVDDSGGQPRLSQGLIIASGDGPDVPEVRAAFDRAGVSPAVTGQGLASTRGASVLPLVLGAMSITLLGGARLAAGRR